MKKFLTVLSGVLVALTLFVTSGNSAKAATDCGCDVSPVFGAEKNKMVADLISSQEFKDAKRSIKNEGYSWRGVKNIEVIINHSHGDAIMIGVPFYSSDRSIEMAVFINGKFMGHQPLEEK
ncbi:hypothetical protein [Neobacillus cucumis]|uniref:DUF3887 domain-containing protein n=1 Tax=Neobacillus cucumis TaxID=1740721 RepID=A0A2N5HVL0_9BACI|nr:hypothetical protein [Neobacillus cucumis]PLS09546.1 hypothetical protein CVD27_01510 [Neobacillus cucumis]